VTARILIVDDDPDILRTLTRGLERRHYHVVCAAQADSAYTILENQQVDVVVLDLLMPQIAGEALALAITSNARRATEAQGSAVSLPGQAVLVRPALSYDRNNRTQERGPPAERNHRRADMTTGLSGSSGSDPRTILRSYRGSAPWRLRDLAALASTLLEHANITPVSSAASALPTERTIRFYVARGLVNPPEGKGTAATY